MTLPPLAARVRSVVAPLQASADPAHDLHHLDRVAGNALRLAASTGADAEVVALAAYVHDLDRAGLALPGAAEEALRKADVPPALHPRVLECVARVSDYSFRPPGKLPCSREAEVLRDADKLDALGAIGVARAFTFGGAKGRALWDGKPLVEGRPYTKTKGGDESTLQHFADKLLRLGPEEFHTAEAKREAARRLATLRRFLDDVRSEWSVASTDEREAP